MRMLKGPNRTVREFDGIDVDRRLRIRGDRGCGVSIAVSDGEDTATYCAGSGRYEHPADADFCIDEVFLRDGDLYARCVSGDEEFTSELYPIGKNTFGRKGGFARIEFGKDGMRLNGTVSKKLQ